MRMQNLPVKIDCYSLKLTKGSQTSEEAREHIGYVLVPVRNIPILSTVKAYQMKARWQKLIGLRLEWRQHHPELLLKCMITDKSYVDANKTEIHEIHDLDAGDSFVFEENPNPCMLQSQNGIFIRLLQEEGLLQVGAIDTNCDIFNIKILMRNMKHLDSIPNAKNDYSDIYINYLLMGSPHIRTLEKKFNHVHQIQEKISINFRSTLKTLQEYFNGIFYIPIEIFVNTQRLGTTEINLKDILQIVELKEFIAKYPKFFECEGTAVIKPDVTADENSPPPTLEYRIKIQYKATSHLHQNVVSEKYKSKHPKLAYDPMGGGDCIAQVQNEDTMSVANTTNNNPSLLNQQTQVTEEVPVKISSKTDVTKIIVSEKELESSELLRLFSFNIRIKSVKLNRKPPRGVYQISFFHEKADMPRTFLNREITDEDCLDEEKVINLNDYELKLYFTAHAENIMDVIKTTSVCTLCFRGPQNTHAKCELDCKSLLNSSAYGNVLLKNQNETVIGIAQVFVFLEDLGPSFDAKIIKTNSQHFLHDETSSANFNKIQEEQKVQLFDESLAYKMVEELEQWKLKEEELFLQELRNKEKSFMEQLNHRWLEKKDKYERELVEKTDKISTMSKTLEEAQEFIAMQNQNQVKSTEDIQKVKRELEQAYNDQLMIIRERSKQLEDDLLHELKLKNIKQEELQQNLRVLEGENCELKRTIESLRVNRDLEKSNSVTREEHESLLKELVR